MTLAARIVATILAVLLCAGEAFTEKRVALVIGNAGYAYAPVLDNPVRDAIAVASCSEPPREGLADLMGLHVRHAQSYRRSSADVEPRH